MLCGAASCSASPASSHLSSSKPTFDLRQSSERWRRILGASEQSNGLDVIDLWLQTHPVRLGPRLFACRGVVDPPGSRSIRGQRRRRPDVGAAVGHATSIRSDQCTSASDWSKLAAVLEQIMLTESGRACIRRTWRISRVYAQRTRERELFGPSGSIAGSSERTLGRAQASDPALRAVRAAWPARECCQEISPSACFPTSPKFRTAASVIFFGFLLVFRSPPRG